jgi:hypothetical protein
VARLEITEDTKVSEILDTLNTAVHQIESEDLGSESQRADVPRQVTPM